MFKNVRRELCNLFVEKVVRRISFISVLGILRRLQQMSSITADISNPPVLLYESLKNAANSVAQYYQHDDSEYGQRLYAASKSLYDVSERLPKNVEPIRKAAPLYDFDGVTIGNGYRSFVYIMDCAVAHAIRTCHTVGAGKKSLFFRKAHFTRELEAISQMLMSLETCFELLGTLMSWSEPGSLFPRDECSGEEILNRAGLINQYCFYGRCMGLQFNEPLRSILKTISLSMVTFSESFYSNGGLASTAANVCLAGGKFFLEPESRAKRLVQISKHAGIDFVKAFWKLSENDLLNKLSNLGSSLEVNRVITIQPESLEIDTLKGDKIVIKPPESHVGHKPLRLRLLSLQRRIGMYGEKEDGSRNLKPLQPPSPGLFIHCHGGGFVAQTSKNQEIYLDGWVQTLNVPTVSIDYSLAPEAPWPRALEEVAYAYCWCLKNLPLLGTTGQRIVFGGDSAGANLILAATQLLITMGVPLPHGIFVAYVPVIISFVPSPSRMMTMMDSLLPLGFMLRCLRAYACPNEPAVSTAEAKANSTSSNSFEEVSEEEVKKEYRRLSCAKGTTLVLDSEIRNGQTVAVVRSEDVNECYNGIFKNAYNLLSRLKPQLATKHVLDNENSTMFSSDFKFSVPKDPLLSPYYAADHILKQFPPVSLCSVAGDPCLDDTVTFAKKLRDLGNVVRLDILDGLPHGFLNFCTINAEAEEGARLCVKRIKDLLDLSTIEPTTIINRIDSESPSLP